MLTIAAMVDGVDIGEIDGWTRCVYQQRLNQAAGFVLSAPLGSPVVDALGASDSQTRYGLIFSDAGHPPVSGTIDRWQETDGATVSISGTEDYGCLRKRWVALEPAKAGPPYSPIADWQVTAPPVDAFRQVIDANMGPGAHPDRRMPGLTVAIDDSGLLPDPIVLTARFDNLADFVDEQGTGRGVAVTALADGDGGTVVTVRASKYLDNVVFDDASAASRTLLSSSSSGNVVLAGGTGDGLLRTFAQVGTAVGWGRVEKWVDARTADTPEELQEAALLEAATSAGTRSLTVDLDDAGPHVLGEDFRLGDWVWLVASGVEGFVRIVGIVATASQTGVSRQLLVGDSSTAAWQQKLLRRRVDALERAK